MMMATGRMGACERSVMSSTTALRTVKTGQSSVAATVRTNSGMIGPGITIHTDRNNANNASANGTVYVSCPKSKSAPSGVGPLSWRGRVWTSGGLIHVFRALTRSMNAVDTRWQCSPSFRIRARRSFARWSRAAREHGYSRCLRVDNGPEFIASALEVWAHDHNVELLFIQPEKPTQNAFIESFIGDELLMTNRFRTIFEARFAAEDWRNEHNTKHSHSSLGGMTPEEFLARYEITNPPQKSLAA